MTQVSTAAKAALPARVSRRFRRTWRSRTPALPRKSFDRQITWVLGSPRSGSTWLMSLLTQHAGIVAINEPQVGYNLTPFLADIDGFDVSGLNSGNFANRRLNRGRRSEFFNEEFAEIWLPDLGRMIRRRLFAEVRGHHHRVSMRRVEVVVQEPNGSQSADLLLPALPTSRLLFLIRDVRDVVDSELSAMAPGSWVSQAFDGSRGLEPDQRVAYARKAAHRWAMRAEVVGEAMRSHPGPTLVVAYEDLRSDTGRSLDRILSWMRLEASDADRAKWVASRAFEKSASTGAKSFTRSATVGGWKSGLDTAELEVVVEVAGLTARSLGYEI